MGVVSLVGLSFGPGVIGALYKPMADDLGWSSTAVAGGVLTGSVLVAITAPISGRLQDRYGAQAILTVMHVLMAACLFGLAMVNSLFAFYALFGIGWSLFAGTGRVASSGAVAQWFVARRGAATAVVNTLVGLGFATMPLLATVAMVRWDWRAGWAAMGIVVFAVGVPVSLLLVRRLPSDVGQEIDGRGPGAGAIDSRSARSAAEEVQWTTHEALHTLTFWVLVSALTVMSVANIGVSFHLVPHLLDRGLSPSIAVLAFTIGGATQIPASFAWGIMLDRLHAKAVYVASGGVVSVYIIVVSLASSVWMVVLIGITMGVGFGGFGLVVRVMFAEYFGRRSAGSIFGIVVPFTAIAQGIGAIVGGIIFDATGSFVGAFMFFLALTLIAMALVFVAPMPTKRPSSPPVRPTVTVD
jgi:MFS family permease